jgi:sulfur carrier protein
MNVTVNGQRRTIAAGTRLAELLDGEHVPARGTAAAVDGEVVPRSNWTQFLLHEGQAVELLTAVQGG